MKKQRRCKPPQHVPNLLWKRCANSHLFATRRTRCLECGYPLIRVPMRDERPRYSVTPTELTQEGLLRLDILRVLIQRGVYTDYS
jgi:hypothetical protein